MNFIKPNLNSLPEQVDINTNDIKNLKSVLKASYKTEKELTTNTITIAISDTNAPQGTTSGWLYDSVGHLYSINSGDDTNLLLEYYTSLQGIQGNEGVGIATIENVGYTDGEGYTITHCKVTLTNGTEEFFDVKAKQGGLKITEFTTTNFTEFINKIFEICEKQPLNILNIKVACTPLTDPEMPITRSGISDGFEFNGTTKTFQLISEDLTNNLNVDNFKVVKYTTSGTNKQLKVVASVGGETYYSTIRNIGGFTCESHSINLNTSTLRIYYNDYNNLYLESGTITYLE